MGNVASTVAQSDAKRGSTRSCTRVAARTRERGSEGLSLHTLRSSVGMRQPSLYEYFDSKHALYDAMFADGNRQLLEQLDAVEARQRPASHAEEVHRASSSTSRWRMRPVRQLLFQRHIAGFAAVVRVVRARRGGARAAWPPPSHAAGVTRPGRHRLPRRHGRGSHRRPRPATTPAGAAGSATSTD